MADVFISHSSIDKEIADKVCAALEAKGLTCWIAPRDIVPGSEWAVAISNAIAEIKAMVVIYSANSQQSTQVPKEIALAEKRGKNILPYKIDDTELTGAFEYYLSGSHWIVADPKKDEYKLDEMYGVIVGMMQQPTQQITKNTYIDNLIIQNPEQVTVQVQDAVAGVKPCKKKVFLVIGMVAAVVALLVGILLVAKYMQSKGEDLKEKENESVSVEQSEEQESEEPTEDIETSQQDTEQIDVAYSVKNGEIAIDGYLGTDSHVVVPATINGIPVTSITDNAFQDCKDLQTIELPKGLKTIGAWAFAESGLTQIQIPDSVSEIGENAFINCVALEKVKLPWELIEISTRCFFGCTGLVELNLPQGLQKIGDGAFAYTPFVTLELTDATITEIGVGAFANCEQLVSVKLPSSVKVVKEGAFQYCTNLTSLVIPDGVEVVAYSAFFGADEVILEYQGEAYTLEEARYLPIMAW
ncbi:MAG: leucine-rich repeat protein [Lachnospiraceae bacterium]|nr:leucine-rich repeat protein [Lachnospiraceae bacterium]